MAFSSLSQLVQSYESGGNYTAKNPTSTASGAYQFTNSTWQQYASMAGVDTAVYPTAASAPPAVQDNVFNVAVSSNGLKDWTCPGCDPGLTNYLSQNPSAANLPIFDASSPINQESGTGFGTGTANTGVMPTSSIWDGLMNTAPEGGGFNAPGVQPVQSGSGILGWLNNLGSWLGGFVTTTEDYVTRGFLILVGLLILGIALWWILARGSNPVEAVKKIAVA